MRKRIRKLNSRFVALAVALLMVLGGIPQAQAAEASGSCGSGVSWNLSGGTLTVSGRGDMTDYTFDSPAPWSYYADSIQAITVENGVTSVGNYAFYQLKKVTAASIADSVTNIGRSAFYECEALVLLDLGNGVRTIGEKAFMLCRSLMSLQLPGSLRSMGDQAFYRCESLMSITIPASVTSMGTETFMYCSSLCSATVLANMKELPGWTFYGCYALKSVSMPSAMESVGLNAFEKCELLPESFDVADEPRDVDTVHTTTGVENGQIVVNDNHYTQQGGSSVNVQTTTQGLPGDSQTNVTVDAVLENQENWSHLEGQVQEALDSSGGDNVDVNINLKGDTSVSGEDLGRFAGQNVDVTIHTQQGAHWHVNGTDINPDELQESYNLSFTLRQLTDPTDRQAEAVGSGTSFVVVFDENIDFKVEVELPLGESLARDTAVFFAPSDNGYARMQAVMIDGAGVAHFYLASVQENTEYLIGINIADRDAESDITDVIIPEQLQNEYPAMEQIEPVEYIVVGRKSSWGMDIGQVTWILAAVMIGSFVIVGAVMFVVFKRKVKRGYVPDMRYEDEIQN